MVPVSIQCSAKSWIVSDHHAPLLIPHPVDHTHAACAQAKRSEILWRALEKIIPDVRSRVKVGLEGTPLTHERFLRRDRGTYGPKIRAGMDQYPSNKPPVEGLWLCGDSVFPGIGMPVRYRRCVLTDSLDHRPSFHTV